MYYLGAQPHWLGPDSPLPERVPVCVSRGRLEGRKTLPRASRRWMLDSKSYTVLSRNQDDGGYARWDISPHQYVRLVREYADQIGCLDTASSMDWMCEGPVRANTGFDISEHLRRTVISYWELRWLDADLQIFPVIQGDASLTVDHHLRCVDMYERAGVDLAALPLVGVGSVCRLPSTARIIALFAALQRRLGTDVRLHAFGVKTDALTAIAPGIYSADSHAWSKHGRDTVRRCPHSHSGVTWEANCPIGALEWYDRTLQEASGTTPATWARKVETYQRRGDNGLLFEDLYPAAIQPTVGDRIASSVRAFLPEGTEPALATMLDNFVTHPSINQGASPCPTTP